MEILRPEKLLFFSPNLIPFMLVTLAIQPKISFFGHFFLKNTCNVWWSKVQDSFANSFFEYKLYLGNMVRSLFRPAGVCHKNTTFSTGHFLA